MADTYTFDVENDPNKPTLCVDFDGVIHSYTSGWQGIDEIPDPPVYGAIEALHEYAKHFNVKIYSARSSEYKGLCAMSDYMRKHVAIYLQSLSSEEIEAIDQPLIDVIGFPSSKPSAIVYIDDRGFRFEGIFPTVEEIMRLSVPWFKATNFFDVNGQPVAQQDIKSNDWNFEPGGVFYNRRDDDDAKKSDTQADEGVDTASPEANESNHEVDEITGDLG